MKPNPRKGQFRRTMAKRFGPEKAGKAERCVQDLKAQGRSGGSPFAICTASMAGTTRRGGRRS
jgi:hypothetical protein